MKTLTKQQTIRIESALKETRRYIDRESKNSADLRSEETQKTLDGYISHAEMLASVLRGDASLVCLGAAA